ncbi:MAG: hypothetical protein AAGB34_01265, partial [Planctomycetota bacterium]
MSLNAYFNSVEDYIQISFWTALIFLVLYKIFDHWRGGGGRGDRSAKDDIRTSARGAGHL